MTMEWDAPVTWVPSNEGDDYLTFPEMFPGGFPQQNNGYGQYAQPGYQQGYGQNTQQQFPPFQSPQQTVQNVQGQGGPPLAQGSLDDFFNQPSVGGGPALKFEVGTRIQCVVSRQVTNADIQQQTQPGSNLPAFYKDGRPKFVMRVSVNLPPSQTYPDGQAQWWVSGGGRDELVRAMAEAGAPDGPPEKGAGLIIECTGTRGGGAGMNPAKVYRVQYFRPDGASPVNVPETPSTQEESQAPPAAQPVNSAPSDAGQAQPPVLQPPGGMTPAQQALMAEMLAAASG